MRLQPAWCLLLLGALGYPALALAQDLATLDDATVIQTDGWRHEHVTVSQLAGGSALRITRRDGAELTLPTSAVAEIRDPEGRIVTHELIPGAAPPAEAPARRPQPWPFRFTLGGGLGYGVPSGEYFEGLDEGRSLHGDLRVAVGPRSYFKLCYRVQEVFEGSIDLGDGGGGQDDLILRTDVEVRQYLLSFGLLSGATEKNLLRAYAEFGLGLGDLVSSLTGGGLDRSHTDDLLLLTLQGGVLIPFGSSPVGLDLGLSATAKVLGDDDAGTGLLVGGQAGLVILFGRDS